MYKKGTVVFRDVSYHLSYAINMLMYQYELIEPGSASAPLKEEDDDIDMDQAEPSKTQIEKDKKKRAKARITVQHVDIIKDDFWERRPWLLSNKPGKIPKEP